MKAGDQDDNMSSDDSVSDQEPMEVSDNYISCVNIRKFTVYPLLRHYGGRINSAPSRNTVIFQVDEVEPKKDRKIESRTRYKGPDNKRSQRFDRTDGKDKKDRTLDPMDPASYSDIPRYVFRIMNVCDASLIIFIYV